MEIKRQTTVKARVVNIVNSRFVRKEGMEPSYILTDSGMRISRTSIIGTVVDTFLSDDGTYGSVTIDDDSGSLRLKAFREDIEKLNDINAGDEIMVIGKVREYSEENYILPEIIRKTTDSNSELLHKVEVLYALKKQKDAFNLIIKEKEKFSDLDELKKFVVKKHRIPPHIIEGVIEVFSDSEKSRETDYKPLVLELLDGLDEGDGMKMVTLMKKANLPQEVFEQTLNDILIEGICYEPIPGIIKRA